MLPDHHAKTPDSSRKRGKRLLLLVAFLIKKGMFSAETNRIGRQVTKFPVVLFRNRVKFALRRVWECFAFPDLRTAP